MTDNRSLFLGRYDLTATTPTAALRERFQMAEEAADAAGNAFERDLWHAADTFAHRADYLQAEMSLMRKAMQHAGTWDQFCADYAAYKQYREEATS